MPLRDAEREVPLVVTSWWGSMAAATLLGAVIGALAAIAAGLAAAWWTARATARRADTDRLYAAKRESYVALMRLAARFRAAQYHWDLHEWSQRGSEARPDAIAPPVPRLEDEEFLDVAGPVRLMASSEVGACLDELEALLFAAHDARRWTRENAYETARQLASLEQAMREDLGVR